ncbi:hypothetical protein Daesc_008504 [Daldinia eschscholtzii]|uniref:Fumarylacetoacetase-like C-terminal domain-containing protein n=1 Tax=Daldinia eschscholtzii TaxID=292717 RepID=A0AAX6MBW0_9PEZI
MSSPAFTNLIRLLDELSVERYGDVTNGSFDNIIGSEVPLLEGDLFDLRRTEKTAIVREGELCVIISKTGKNIPEDKAFDYVLGVTAGNDLSSRKWQRPPYSGGQFTYAKSFDNFAPIGPTILHHSFIPAKSPLQIKTTVNGEVRQNGSTSDMLFNIEKIIAHASRGTTLRQGTIIMTGTPAGIAAKWPGQPWLKDGDVVEVNISGIGSLKNKLVFETEP